MTKRPFLVGITGGTASGKTFVIEALKNYFEGNILVISQDQYFKDMDKDLLDRWEHANLDAPQAFDNRLLETHLKKILKGESVMSPVYDFSTHSRKNEKIELIPKPLIILEGIQIFHERYLRRLMNMRIFLDASADIRLSRRLLRDIDERGLTTTKLHSDIERYINTVKPMHDKFVEPMKRFSHVVINTDKGSLDAAEYLIKRLSKEMKKRGLVIEEKELKLTEYQF